MIGRALRTVTGRTSQVEVESVCKPRVDHVAGVRKGHDELEFSRRCSHRKLV